MLLLMYPNMWANRRRWLYSGTGDLMQTMKNTINVYVFLGIEGAFNNIQMDTILEALRNLGLEPGLVH